MYKAVSFSAMNRCWRCQSSLFSGFMSLVDSSPKEGAYTRNICCRVGPSRKRAPRKGRPSPGQRAHRTARPRQPHPHRLTPSTKSAFIVSIHRLWRTPWASGPVSGLWAHGLPACGGAEIYWRWKSLGPSGRAKSGWLAPNHLDRNLDLKFYGQIAAPPAAALPAALRAGRGHGGAVPVRRGRR